MKRLCVVLLLSLLVPANGWAADTTAEAAALNEQGIAALKKVDTPGGYAQNVTHGDWQAVFDKFQDALKIDPSFELARKNLSIAHNNFALYLYSREHKFSEALTELHKAVYIDPANKTTMLDLCGVISGLGKNPNKFEDRVELGDNASTNKDLPGAIVEYSAALGLKEDTVVHKKLNDVCDSLATNAVERCSTLLKIQADPELHKMVDDQYKLMHDRKEATDK